MKCGTPRPPRRRRRGPGAALDDEATLGAGGDDDGVLHRLRAHQVVDLGAEVVGPIAQADAAAGDAAAAQVHALDVRRVHVDLVERVRAGQMRDVGAVELHRQRGIVAGARSRRVRRRGRGRRCARPRRSAGA